MNGRTLIVLAGLILLSALLVPRASGQDSLAADTVEAAADTVRSDSALTVTPWEFRPSLGSRQVASDSTLRWQIWPDWTYRMNREPSAITYRLGTAGRSNAVQTGAHEPRYQQLYWENIPMNDPVSGTARWQVLPHSRILRLYEEDIGGAVRSRYFLKPYYLVEPLSRISYEESSFSTRSLEFMISHNLSRRTNAEVSYLDRRDGGEYPRSETAGQQVFARLFHQLNKREALKLQFLNDRYDTDHSFGYQVPDHIGYHFNRFAATAREAGAGSEGGSTVLALQYYRRPADSARTVNNLQAGLYYRHNSRRLEYSADSVSYRLPSAGGSVRRWWRWKPLRLEGGIDTRHLLGRRSGASSYTRDYLGRYSADATLQYRPIPMLDLSLEAAGTYRSDGYREYRVGAGMTVEQEEDFRLSGRVSAGARMPTPQQLYWSSAGYSGNPGLEEERFREMHAGGSVRLLPGLRLGSRVQFRRNGGAVRVGADSLFVNGDPYWSSSLSAELAYESAHLEVSGSALLHSLGEEGPGWNGRYGGVQNRKLWLRGGLYWKGYIFNRAAYLKTGLSGMASLYRYRPQQYRPVLDFWQAAGTGPRIPRFHRLDFDLSARVRSIMVTVRWENVLDDLTQSGYFETAGYPMAGRRFIFGIRALFRN